MQIQKYLSNSFSLDDFVNPKESRIAPEIWELAKPFVFERLNTQDKIKNELALLRERSHVGSLYRLKLTYQEELSFLYKFVCIEETQKVLADIQAIAQFELLFGQLPQTRTQKALLVAAGYLDAPKKAVEPDTFGKTVEQHLNTIMERYQAQNPTEEF